MTKSELEQTWREYSTLITQALEAEKRLEILSVIKFAESSWPHIDGMLRHVSKQTGQPVHALEGIALVLRYAPAVFNDEVLTRLEQFLIGKRRITKSAASDLKDDLARSRDLVWRAYAAWDQMEREHYCKTAELRHIFAGIHDGWERTIRIWESINSVRTLSIAGHVCHVLETKMDRIVSAKCPSCGTTARRSKAETLTPTSCARCRRSVLFVQISEAPLIEPNR